MTSGPVHGATASRRPGGAAVLVVLILVLVGLAQTHAGRAFTDRIGVSAPGQPYTELYFADTSQISALTEQPHRGRLNVPIDFVIADQQHRSVHYAWVLTVSGHTIAQGVQDLGQGQKITIHRRIAINCPARRARAPKDGSAQSSPRIAVLLATQNETIDAHVNCRA